MESYKCGPVTYIGCYEIWILHILSVSLVLKTMGKWRARILIEAGWRDIRGYLLVHLPALGHEWATPTCFLASWQLFNLLLRTSDGDGSSCCWEFNNTQHALRGFYFRLELAWYHRPNTHGVDGGISQHNFSPNKSDWHTLETCFKSRIWSNHVGALCIHCTSIYCNKLKHLYWDFVISNWISLSAVFSPLWEQCNSPFITITFYISENLTCILLSFS